mgnify:CR=1 FL=1
MHSEQRDKVVGRDDKSRTNRTMISHDLAARQDVVRDLARPKVRARAAAAAAPVVTGDMSKVGGLALLCVGVFAGGVKGDTASSGFEYVEEEEKGFRARDALYELRLGGGEQGLGPGQGRRHRRRLHDLVQQER